MKIFNGITWGDYSETRRVEIRKTVMAEDQDKLLGMDEQQYIDYLVSRFEIEPIQFDLNGRSINSSEVMVPAERLSYGAYVQRGASYPRQQVSVFVPFTGSQALLAVQPSTHIMKTFDVNIAVKEISFSVIDVHNSDERLKADVTSNCEYLVAQANHLNFDISCWNGALRQVIGTIVRERRAEALRRRNSIASLGIPMRQSGNASQTYPIPLHPKKIVVRKPDAPSNTFVPDPAMEDADYQKIITLLHDTGRSLERTPGIAAMQSEEGLRDYLLVPLSGHYENATGESFRRNGKTDILVPYQGGNAFVAEIKIWHGSKEFSAAIDQLLTYLTWRDSKGALIVFVRQSGITEAIQVMDATVRAHPQWASSASPDAERRLSTHRLKLTQDPSRLATVTVMPFHLPDAPNKRVKRKI